MVNVQFFKDKKGNYIKLISKGHSGFANRGQDIVCSAISSAVIINVNGCIEVINVGHKIEQKEGYLYFEIIEEDLKKIDYCNILLESLYIGLTELMRLYPKNIKVEVKENENYT